ncbi:MAG: hypothetical protein HOO67_02680 [Candidatus Peribacteraceae bacterium]|nr:hypothetical protein [Candidatus Peribacteraceae bacterium]
MDSKAKYNCHDCLKQYGKRKDAETMLQKTRESKACFDFAAEFIHNIDGQIYFKKCIGNYFNGVWVRFVEMERQYEKGVLPYPGSLSEQPAKILEIFRIIAAYRQEQIAEEQKKARIKEREARGRK